MNIGTLRTEFNSLKLSGVELCELPTILFGEAVYFARKNENGYMDAITGYYNYKEMSIYIKGHKDSLKYIKNNL